MRVFVLTLAMILAAGHANAEPQGFLDSFTNFFRPRPQPVRPAPRPVQQRPPPQQFQQGPPQQAAQPAPGPQQFRRPPPQQPQQQFRQPPPQQQFRQPPQQQQPQQQQQQQFRQPPVETFRRPAQQVNNRPPQQQVINSAPVINNAPVIQTTAAPAARACNADNNQGVNGCPGACPNDVDEKGKPVILTYKVNEELCSKFTQSEAKQYCERQGGRLVSLDSNERSQFFINIAIRDRKRYFWTGGNIDHNAGVVTWPSGAREGYIRGERYWSTTGGIDEKQPDNRDGNEFCIAVLNNFYADGVKWHDVGCHHKKPTICEFA